MSIPAIHKSSTSKIPTTAIIIDENYSEKSISPKDKFAMVNKAQNQPLKVLKLANHSEDYANVSALLFGDSIYYSFKERTPIAKLSSVNPNYYISGKLEIFRSKKSLDLMTVKVPKEWINQGKYSKNISEKASKFSLISMIKTTKKFFPKSTLVFERYRGYKIIDESASYFLGSKNLKRNFQKLLDILDEDSSDNAPIVSIELDYSNKVIVKRSSEDKRIKKS